MTEEPLLPVEQVFSVIDEAIARGTVSDSTTIGELLDEVRGARKPGLSFSSVSRYRSCGMKWKLSYLDEAPREPSGAAIAGSTIHAIIERSEQELLWQRDDYVELFKDLFVEEFVERLREVGGMDIPRWGGTKRIVVDESGNKVQAVDDNGEPAWRVNANGKRYPVWLKAGEDAWWWVHEGPLMLRRYVTVRRTDTLGGLTLVPGGAERYVETTLDDGTHVRGYIDAVMMADTATGEAVIRDYKSGSMLEPTQLAWYAFLWQASTGMSANRGQLIYLRGKEAAQWVKEYDLSRWVGLVPTWVKEAQKGMDAEVYMMNPGSFCPSCDVRVHCPFGSTLEDA